MKKLSILLAGILLILASTTVFAHRGARHWYVDLQPLNDSGVTGTAWLTLEDGSLTVSIEATGLEADLPHPQHIHGFANPSNATCPTIVADTDGDGIISVGEGAPYYGPVLIPLTPFTSAPGGVVSYQATFTDLSAIEPVNTLQNRAIVLHGLTIDGAYVPSTPIACGQIRPAPNGP